MQYVYGFLQKSSRHFATIQNARISTKRNLANVASALDLAKDLDEKSEEYAHAIPRASWALSQKTVPKGPLSEEDCEEIERNNKIHEGFKIPSSAFVDCKTAEDIQAVKDLYARQIQLELNVNDDAKYSYNSVVKNLQQIGKASELGTARKQMYGWYEPMTEAIRREQSKVTEKESGMDRTLYGPALQLLDAEKLTVITLVEMINATTMEAAGARFLKLAGNLGLQLQAEVNAATIKNDKKWGDFAKMCARINSSLVNKHAISLLDQAEEWDLSKRVKIGAALISLAIDSCKVEVDGEKVPAFEHHYLYTRNRRIGFVKCHEKVYDLVLSSQASLAGHSRYLPMLTPPLPWTDYNVGGYLRLKTKVMRNRDMSIQLDKVQRCDMTKVYEALNALASLEWQINKPVFEVVKKIWIAGGNFGDIPRRDDFDLPDIEDYDVDNPMDMKSYRRSVFKIDRKNRELHCLRCDSLYKLQVAEEFKDEEKFYFPCNVDFRGRVYPIPPNLNHLGSDMCRSLLKFREAKPLGKNGLKWLKVHLANVFGVDKVSFSCREKFIDDHIDDILDSANNPISGRRWWESGEAPFQTLAMCFEVRNALQCDNPEEYMCSVPVHQDGSCNGLQHYAALGKDATGAFQVNLLPSDRPQDVYSGVADRVLSKVRKDAAKPNPNQEYAKLVLDHITRKVVKQTVMTSVYGVTYIGARKQIQARLEERLLDEHTNPSGVSTELENQIYFASCYLARVTISSIGDLFKAAKDIMAWLTETAKLVAEANQPMCWITPLGLPVVQPYRKTCSNQVRTIMQHVIIAQHSEAEDVGIGRQKSAFPPNFVHSLDSTHMMMTALRCKEEGIAFAAVHDSYWTHAGTVEDLNNLLREQFIALHEQPLLEDLLSQLKLRFPSIAFSEIPERGTLDLKDVMNSKYFFN